MITTEYIKEKLFNANYIASDQIVTTVYLALKLKKPILIEGPAGVGKTDLANCLSRALDLDFFKLQCYEGIDESKALYEWEYSKQLLYTQILKDKLSEIIQSKHLTQMVDELNSFKSIFFSEQFLLERPLLKAIKNDKPSILLIDEIDKSEPEFEAFLLEILSEWQVSIPEIGIIKNKQIPLVILTSNNQRTISDALRRRALYLHIDYPSKEIEKQILKAKIPNIDDILIDKIIKVIENIRNYPLKKHPGVSEMIEWSNSLLYLNEIDVTKENLEKTLNILVKYKSDYELLLTKLYDLV